MKTFKHFFNHKILSQFSIVEIDIEVRKKKVRRHLSILHPFVPMSALLLFKGCISVIHSVVNSTRNYFDTQRQIRISNRFQSTSHIEYDISYFEECLQK